jgi:hypothetical protein
MVKVIIEIANSVGIMMSTRRMMKPITQ